MNGEDVVYLHNEILVSMDEWKNEIMPVTATWMDLENIIVREISQTEKDKYHICLHANLKIWYK